jgi:hypothetical protein
MSRLLLKFVQQALLENGGEKMVHVSGRFAAAAELNSATL